MNFFELQERSFRNTRVLLAMMTLAVIVVVACVTAVFAAFSWGYSTPARAMPFTEWSLANLRMLAMIAGTTVVVIGVASLYRMHTLKSGGSIVAANMGGTRVSRDSDDPLHQRLRNVVDEMAIASGVPAPAIYVLENEDGINAFAAGFSADDAAVAVTRGTLQKLDRDELQGVIAHEFSHILNGDMRLNIQLMGPLFGLLAITLIGRTLMRGSRTSSRGKGAGPAILLGVGLAAIGYIGLLFGRLIKAGISRQREYLADASAVQFTRQTFGIAGALKKISGIDKGSYFAATDAEEVSHMLFAAGFSSVSRLLATHPPLFRRIKALDPGFDPEAHGQTMIMRSNLDQVTSNAHAARSIFMDTVTINTPALADAAYNSIGQPNDEHVHAAHEFLQNLPSDIRKTLNSSEQVLLLIPAILLHTEASVRMPQMQLLRKQLGSQRTNRIATLQSTLVQLDRSARLPLLELALPALRDVPELQKEFTAALLEQIALSDNRLEVFEFALLRVVDSYIRHTRKPAVRRWRNLDNPRMQEAAAMLLRVMAFHSHANNLKAAAAFAKGMEIIDGSAEYEPLGDDWPKLADQALTRLTSCTPAGRATLVRGLSTVGLSGHLATTHETELLRAFCTLLECPMPPILDA